MDAVVVARYFQVRLVSERITEGSRSNGFGHGVALIGKGSSEPLRRAVTLQVSQDGVAEAVLGMVLDDADLNEGPQIVAREEGAVNVEGAVGGLSLNEVSERVRNVSDVLGVKVNKLLTQS